MAKGTGAVHIATQRRKYTGKDGVERVYESQLLRRSFREHGRVRNETREPHRAATRGGRGRQSGPGRSESRRPRLVVTVARSLPHGHLAAAAVMAKKLGLPALLGPASRHREIAMASILARTVAPVWRGR
ncbi:hypothetical protein [Rhodococcus wratislaviensis]|uniref:Transposase n=1 Tax=Rhodococcus wratislaviensis NBRC 100605 TaxID=1219028 RepID=X0PZG3_RHOWR|nr:hypothetical protein [Rhodococcus wratislaviensis]GAF49064.1 hypothetical protein RW1_066_00310 [Rhodococcus wratislaviensis NBRC 100605]